MNAARVELDQLVTGAEIGRRMKPPISTQRIHQLRESDPAFPQPLGIVGKAIVWRWRDVEAWAKKSGRLPD